MLASALNPQLGACAERKWVEPPEPCRYLVLGHSLGILPAFLFWIAPVYLKRLNCWGTRVGSLPANGRAANKAMMCGTLAQQVGELAAEGQTAQIEPDQNAP